MRLKAILARARLTLQGLHNELRGISRLAADPRSFMRFVVDAIAYRINRFVRIGSPQRHRTVRFRGGNVLTYRLNRGDIRAIAETWMAGAYELPVELETRNVIDLGANIGSKSVWLARRYGANKVVAVEPSPGNAELVRINLRSNGIDGEVLEAAIAPTPGRATFDVTADSTWGRLSDHGIEVELVTPQSVIDRFAADQSIDLLKMDVEGAERELFEADLSWLQRVRCVVAELHGDRVDVPALIRKLDQAGFEHVEIAAANKYLGETDVMAMFVRREQVENGSSSSS